MRFHYIRHTLGIYLAVAMECQWVEVVVNGMMKAAVYNDWKCRPQTFKTKNFVLLPPFLSLGKGEG